MNDNKEMLGTAPIGKLLTSPRITAPVTSFFIPAIFSSNFPGNISRYEHSPLSAINDEMTKNGNSDGSTLFAVTTAVLIMISLILRDITITTAPLPRHTQNKIILIIDEIGIFTLLLIVKLLFTPLKHIIFS